MGHYDECRSQTFDSSEERMRAERQVGWDRALTALGMIRQCRPPSAAPHTARRAIEDAMDAHLLSAEALMLQLRG